MKYVAKIKMLVKIYSIAIILERSGSVMECSIRDRAVGSSGLT